MAVVTGGGPVAHADAVPGGRALRVHVADAVGGKTVVGQLAVAGVTRNGFVTAYGCDDGIPTDRTGAIARADLNFFGTVAPIWSNRLIVEADDDGDVCFYTSASAQMVIDVNGISFDTGIESFPNRRTDTRTGTPTTRSAGDTLRIHVPEAVGRRTVIGQLAVTNATDAGHITAYPCTDGLPTSADGRTNRADLNYLGTLTPTWSNRLVVQADTNGDICLHNLTPVDLVVDINATADRTAIFSMPNQRFDTRDGPIRYERATPASDVVPPDWGPYEVRPGATGVAALTGLPIPAEAAGRPITAVKIDNYARARPQWGLERADAVLEVEVEGVTRFIALFQSDLPADIGPVRSARTGDFDLLFGMNRPAFAYSGANPGVQVWIAAAQELGRLVDDGAESVTGCYHRRADRPGPHNLGYDLACGLSLAPNAGGPLPLWSIDGGWSAPSGLASWADTEFGWPFNGVDVLWRWDAGTGSYVRSQDGQPHVADSGAPIVADNVVEVRTVYRPSVVDERSPHAVTVGSGDAVVHRNGRAYPVRWERPTAESPYRFVDSATGHEVPLGTGRTFLELVPAP